jgi:hypothetical protein
MTEVREPTTTCNQVLTLAKAKFALLCKLYSRLAYIPK